MDDKSYRNLVNAIRLTDADYRSAEEILGRSYFDFELARLRIQNQMVDSVPRHGDTLAGKFGWHIAHRSRRLQTTELLESEDSFLLATIERRISD